jgi:hypothetical protein
MILQYPVDRAHTVLIASLYTAQIYVENEYEDDDENDAYEIVNPTRPRPR